MKMFSVLIFTITLSACAQLPDTQPASAEPATQDTMASWILPLINDTESTQLLMCDVKTSRDKCSQPRAGLEATGLGGIFLPLKVSLPMMTIKANQANIHVAINGIDAACTTGSVKTNLEQALVEINNVFCNWLVIGNVLSNLKLSIDWDDPQSRTFGGRYAISFFGTGNGSGSGIYSAEVKS